MSSPAAEGILEELQERGFATRSIPRRLEPNDLAAAMIATVGVVHEVGAALPDVSVAVQRGMRIRQPEAEWVWVLWTDEGAERARKALGS